ncbi:hypothetical protein QTO34_000482 [Cnephaeus nilssonii]|uniref:Uncharacterized protein n=1 Tax=Cnephaeus nilssonii TaxID=3371016 RepID=A0AA40LWZ8_CNENI|nr:hypothetical protein QTO34_000482 [Eptesicus nilssonii]
MSQDCHTCSPGPCGEEDRAAALVGKGHPDSVGTAGHVAGLPAATPGTLQNLSSEKADSLPTLKPKGNILHILFKSFQRRNMIKLWERAQFKLKYKGKLVEKQVFWEIQL